MKHIWEAVYMSNGELQEIYIDPHCCEGRPVPDYPVVCLNLVANTVEVCCTGVIGIWGWTDVELGKIRNNFIEFETTGGLAHGELCSG